MNIKEKSKSMKKTMATLLSLLILFTGYSQSAYTTATYNPNVDSVAEALVALAMNNPSVRSSENFAQQYKYLYKVSKTTWLNNIVLQGNLNEYSFQNTASTDPLKQSTQYPKYNFGVIVPIGIFINSPKQAKADYYKYQFAVEQVNVEKQNIRREVLINYQDYTMNRQLLSQYQQLVSDWGIIHKKNEQKFSNGEITLEAFYASTKTYTDELSKQSNINNALRTSEARLEALIGMNVEDALAQIYSRSKQN